MATTTTTTTPAKAGTDVTTLAAEAQAIEVQSLDSLKKAYDKALGDWTKAKDDEDAARVAKLKAAVWMARIAYRAASHEAIANKRYPYNITGAAKALGKPVATLRPYAIAGAALAKADKAGLLSEPSDEDMAIVDKSFEDGAREQQREKRRIEREKKEKLAAAARELEELKAKGATTPAPTGDTTPAPTGDATPAPTPATPATPAKGGTTPATPAPAEGPSLGQDAIRTARQLVAQIKALRENKGWREVAPEVNAILAEVYPSLGK